jgi:hypothetical protein
LKTLKLRSKGTRVRLCDEADDDDDEEDEAEDSDVEEDEEGEDDGEEGGKKVKATLVKMVELELEDDEDEDDVDDDALGYDGDDLAAMMATVKVGRCRFDPIKPTLNAPGPHLLTLECDEPLLNFAFKFNLRRYIKAKTPAKPTGPAPAAAAAAAAGEEEEEKEVEVEEEEMDEAAIAAKESAAQEALEVAEAAAAAGAPAGESEDDLSEEEAPEMSRKERLRQLKAAKVGRCRLTLSNPR